MNGASLNSMKKLVLCLKLLSKCQYLAKIMRKVLDSEILWPICWLSWTKQKFLCWIQLNWRRNIWPCRYCLFGDFLLHYFPFCPHPQLARVVLVSGSRCVSVTATIVQTSWCRGSSWHPSSCPALPLPAQTSRSPSQTSAANRLIGEVVQSRRRPLLGPSLGWKWLLQLFHVRHCWVAYDLWSNMSQIQLIVVKSFRVSLCEQPPKKIFW